MSAIENFLNRYDNAHKGRGKEVRLMMDEARDLAHELGLAAIENSELQKQIIKLQAELVMILKVQASEPQEIELDGGKFKAS